MNERGEKQQISFAHFARVFTTFFLHDIDFIFA